MLPMLVCLPSRFGKRGKRANGRTGRGGRGRWGGRGAKGRSRRAAEAYPAGGSRRSGSIPPGGARGGRPQRSAGGRFVGRGAGDQDEAAEALLGMGFGLDVSAAVVGLRFVGSTAAEAAGAAWSEGSALPVLQLAALLSGLTSPSIGCASAVQLP